ncbi:MAG TPA: 16S rRNA (adenine(1518)-N(6)/adenine(1519)-N(6))-dimethyltransferase RsmA [Dissulfurispiraceae bacterium]|nr:16S rRNA (adenine(1518)-N(6)/adenine(1519)-N(6))-dimethyltransferase RsmA [Dissulfurispiraceae bacterium]
MAKKYLGQHFLFDPATLSRIVDVSGITPEDTIVEIGPGPGSMTQILASRAKLVIAVELDDKLYMSLLARFEKVQNIELHHADALKFDYSCIGIPFKVVANIPYYITTPLIFMLMDAKPLLSTMTLTIQKEVAERIVAAPGSKDYGVLSISVQYFAKTKLEFVIPAASFKPVPKVDSAVIRIEMLEQPSVSVTDEGLFFKIVRAGFSQRRKTLSNALKALFPDIRRILVDTGIDPLRRAETLSMEEFAKLADSIKNI